MNGDAASHWVIRNGNPKLLEIATDRGDGGTSGSVLTTCRKIFQEFTLKAEYAYDYGMPQWMAKLDRVFEPFHIERLWLGRHKFCHFRIWYKNDLSEYVREILLDKRTFDRPFWNRDFLTRMVAGHINGTFNYTTEISTVLTVELIHRLFLDR
jgi:asparagine synthase (glutamine-hydrolysing)